MRLNKKVAQKNKPLNYLNNKEALLLGFSESGNSTPAFVYLKYYNSSFECFSEWQTNELKLFSQFVNKLKKTTWMDIYKSAGKIGHKAGFGYTIHKNTTILPNQNLVNTLSEDVTFFELRVSGTIRVHGFRQKSVFFLIWLDRAHKIYAS